MSLFAGGWRNPLLKDPPAAFGGDPLIKGVKDLLHGTRTVRELFFIPLSGSPLVRSHAG
jgi:hypothetical protein